MLIYIYGFYILHLFKISSCISFVNHLQLFLYVYLLYRQCKFILFQSVFDKFGQSILSANIQLYNDYESEKYFKTIKLCLWSKTDWNKI